MKQECAAQLCLCSTSFLFFVNLLYPQFQRADFPHHISNSIELINMKFFTATSALALSAFGMASSVANGEGAIATVRANGGTNTVSADLLHRLLFSMDDVDTEEELKYVCDLTDERLAELRMFRKFLIEYQFAGDVGVYQTFKERAVNIAFLLANKDKETQELDATDFLQLVSMSGISGLSFTEVLECIGGGVGLSYEEVLYIFCLGGKLALSVLLMYNAMTVRLFNHILHKLIMMKSTQRSSFCNMARSSL